MTGFKLGEPTVIGTSYVAKYDSFRVGSESENYKLLIGQYDVTASTLADGFAAGGHNEAPFSTKDRNNAGSCAKDYLAGNDTYTILWIQIGFNTLISMIMHLSIIIIHRMVVQQLWPGQSQRCKLLWVLGKHSTEYRGFISSSWRLA